MHRIAAGLVALVAWAALAIQFKWSFSQTGDLFTTLWVLIRFFTILTNLLVAITMSSVGSSRVDLQACKLEYSIVSPK